MYERLKTIAWYLGWPSAGYVVGYLLLHVSGIIK